MTTTNLAPRAEPDQSLRQRPLDAAANLMMGARLAVRTDALGWLRLTMTAVGIAMCVAALLLCASIGSALQKRDDRSASVTPMSGPPGDPAAAGRPLFQAHTFDQTYQGLLVTGIELAAIDTGAPPPPGVAAFPAPGQVALSPALRDLLASPAGAALRPRIDGQVVGIISPEGLIYPEELRFYRGIHPTGVGDQGQLGGLLEPVGLAPPNGGQSWGWGQPNFNGEQFYGLGRFLDLILVTGTAVILVPLLIFVSLMSRLGGAARNRRSAALRLAGASSAQLRRIAAGETLVGAAAGVLLGSSVFLLARQSPLLQVGGAGFFPAEVSPNPGLAVLIVLIVPVIATVTTIVATHRTAGQPLAPARSGAGRPARIGWRLAVIVAGVLLVGAAWRQGFSEPLIFAGVSGGVLLGLALIPLLLPWILERLTNVLPTSGIGWQLAVRRIQLDSGTAARSVAGVSVVVAAAIALQVVLTLTSSPINRGFDTDRDLSEYRAQVQGATQTEIADILSRFTTTAGVTRIRSGSILFVDNPNRSVSGELLIGSCAQILSATGIADCHPGDTLVVSGRAGGLPPGATVVPRNSPQSAGWKIPTAVRTVATTDYLNGYAPDLIVESSALGPDSDLFLAQSTFMMSMRDESAAPLDELRNRLGDFGWRASVTSFTEWAAGSATVQLQSTMRAGLLLGGGLTLLVALAGLLVTAVEQLTERRRALTLAVATGIPRSTITRSLLIGAAVPITVGVVLAIGVGAGLATYLTTLLGRGSSVHPGTAALIAGSAIAAVLVVTAATLPAVRPLTRTDTLRTE